MKFACLLAMLSALCTDAHAQGASAAKPEPARLAVEWKWERQLHWDDYAARVDRKAYVVRHAKDPRRENWHRGTFELRCSADGRKLISWPGHEYMPFLISGGRLFVIEHFPASPGGQARAMDIASGKVLWEARLVQNSPQNSPAGDGKFENKVCAAICDGAIYIHSMQTGGRFVWVFRADDGCLLASAFFNPSQQ